MPWIGVKILEPLANNVLVQVEIAGGLGYRYAPVVNQPDCLNLELFRKTPPNQNAPPASPSHLNLVSVKPAAAHTIEDCQRRTDNAAAAGLKVQHGRKQ